MVEEKTVRVDVKGLGIILYSGPSVSHIREGEDYLTSKYCAPEQVLEHVYQGTIIGFCTSSPGTYHLQFLNGYPDDDLCATSDFTLRLGLHVKSTRVFVRDLYDLMKWTAWCPSTQTLSADDGYYHVTLCSSLPASKILGDEQSVTVYMSKLDKMPRLRFAGIPVLCE
ncbi:MAG: hypothetical protein AB1646_24615 [Thermodesulfobacteriota bacterium]